MKLLIYATSKSSFFVLVLPSFKGNESADAIAATCAMHTVQGYESMATCVYLIDSGIESSLPRQKANTSSTLPSGWNQYSAFKAGKLQSAEKILKVCLKQQR